MAVEYINCIQALEKKKVKPQIVSKNMPHGAILEWKDNKFVITKDGKIEGSFNLNDFMLISFLSNKSEHPAIKVRPDILNFFKENEIDVSALTVIQDKQLQYSKFTFSNDPDRKLYKEFILKCYKAINMIAVAKREETPDKDGSRVMDTVKTIFSTSGEYHMFSQYLKSPEGQRQMRETFEETGTITFD
jgi:hypothetical protein